jgi:hypothetical protein
MLALLMSGWAAAVLVDDFETYTPGDLATVGAPTWTVAADRATIVAETGNQYITYNNPVGGWAPAERALPFNVSSQATLFFRIYLTAEALDHAVGLTDNAAAGWYDQYGPYVRVTDDTAAVAGVASLDVRNGGAFVDDVKALTLNQWYNVWLVVNPTAGTFDVYCNQGAAGATSADLARAGSTFRKAYANPLIGFLLYGANAANARVDDVYLSAGSDLSYPLIAVGAHNPTPANGATGIPTSATLSWYTGLDPANPANPNPNITKHYISFRKGDPNLAGNATLAEVSPASVTSWTPPTTGSNAMARDATYYWRIDESVNNSSRTDPNTIVGSLWSFETQVSIPVITQQPVETRVFKTEPNAVLTCKFTSVSSENVTATWYKYVDGGVNDIPLSSGGDIVITLSPPVGEEYTSTLQINTPDDADQGNYYCKTNNGTAVNSNTVALVIKRLLAQYDFNGNLAPKAPESKADAPTGQGKSVAGLTEPNSLRATNITLAFVTGFDGTASGAVTLVDPNQYIDFGTVGYPKAGSLLTGIGDGLDTCTILCWVKPTQTTHSLSVLNNYNNDITTGIGFSVETNMDARINVRGEPTEILTINGRPNRPEYNIFDGQWHLIGVRWDAKALSSVVYVDGQWVVADTSMGTPTQYAAWQRGVLVGAGRQGSPNRHLLTNLFSGAVDKLRIYNYEVPSDAIAAEYFTATGIQPCTNMTFTGNTYNLDNTGSSYCKIDLADVIIFASKWLDCGLYPDCP